MSGGNTIRTAMVMAAGMGTRMLPLTKDRPKPLVAIAGTTLLDHVLDHLGAGGVERIVVNVHYLADMVEAHLTTHARDLEVAISDERAQLLETGGGLFKAKAILGDAPFFCVNTDNVWINGAADALRSLAAGWDDSKMDVLMLLIPRERANNHAGPGDFHLGKDGLISRRLPDHTAPFVWTGIQILSPRLIADPPSDAFSTNIFWDRAITAGRCFGAVFDGQWFDVGTPAAIPSAEAALRANPASG